MTDNPHLRENLIGKNDYFKEKIDTEESKKREVRFDSSAMNTAN